MKRGFISLIAVLVLQSAFAQSDPDLKVGLVADPQYANKPAAGKRFYPESLYKLKRAIVTFNHHHVDFVQSLGDIIDGGWENFDSIIPVYRNLHPEIENFHLLGNHDFAIDSSHLEDLLETLSMPDFYYSYVKKEWRFLVLDATDYAFYSNGLHHHPLDQVKSYYAATEGKPNHFTWNSAVGEKQQRWLKQELDSAELLGQKVIVFSHHPVRPLNNEENLWNDDDIINILESSSSVAAFINGHNHSGDYIFKNGIHYITVHGMVETENNSYAILEIFKDQMILRGYGNQKSYRLDPEP